MRIGVDCQALQSPNTRQRGIGVYTNAVLSQLLARPQDEYHLFYNSSLPAPDTAPGPATQHFVRYATRAPVERSTLANELLQRLAYEARDLDVLHVASPTAPDEIIVDAGAARRPYAMACALFDLIPLIFADHYLRDPAIERSYLRRLEIYRHADVVLAISERSRADAVELLGLPEQRVVNVGAAADPAFERLDPEERERRADLVRRRFGIRGPFVLAATGFDFRKNLEGTMQAFGDLPAATRRDHQLVVVCALTADQAAQLHRQAQGIGIDASLVLTGYVSQVDLVALYNCCAAFVFASLYEGFGLPVLEAMSCGAPVVASNTSSIPEVLGDSGILVDPADPRAIAGAIQKVLGSKDLQRELGARGRHRATRFDWATTAQATRSAFERALDGRRKAVRTRVDKPRIAFFSPLPPQQSGIADYSAELLHALSAHFEIDVYVDPEAAPPSLADCPARLYPLPPSLDGRSYFSWLYQMGNSTFHTYMYNVMPEHPGVTVLHDPSLHGFVRFVTVLQQRKFGRYAEELVHESGPLAAAALEMLLDTSIDEETVAELFPLNERVLCSSKAVVVHSAAARDGLLSGRSAQLRARVRHIEQGMKIPRLPTPQEKRELRVRYGLPARAIVIGTFGFMAESKQLERGLRAIGAMAGHGVDAYWIAVGRFLSPEYESRIRELTGALGIGDRVAFVGHVPLDDFYGYLFASDVVLSLRHPSRGETSAAMLRAMSCALPTVVYDDGSFAELPDDAVVKVTPDADEEAQLIGQLQGLAEDAGLRARIGAAARRHIVDHHSWEAVAQQYADLLYEVEATGLGDQQVLDEALKALVDRRSEFARVSRAAVEDALEAFAVNEGLGRRLWV